MPLSPLCLVSDNGGSYVPTTNGVNVGQGDTIRIQLQTPSGVGVWYLVVYGTDELSTPPTLSNVDPSTGQVASPSSIVTFTFPGMPVGRSIVFQSTVVSGPSTAQTTFGIYSLTPNGVRVGAVGETREGNVSFGWAALLNPVMRQGAAYLYYNDTLASPSTGSNTIQGAIDYLKTHSGGGLAPTTNVAFVSTTGNDGTGDGSLGKPFATYSAAAASLASIATSSNYCSVQFGPGQYSENIELVPWIFLTGFDSSGNTTILNGTLELNSSFATSGAITGISAVTQTGTIDLNYVGIGADDSTQVYVLDSILDGYFTIEGTGSVLNIQTCYGGPDEASDTQINTSGSQFFSFTATAPNVGLTWDSNSDTFHSGSYTVDGTAQACVFNLIGSAMDATSTLTLEGSGASWTSPVDGVPPTVDLFSGAPTPILTSSAIHVSYTPTTPGDWGTVPTQTGQALDLLAAAGGSGGITLEEGGTPISGNPHSTINVTGNASVADAGGGVATLNVPGITFESSGTPISGGTHTTLNVTGSGATLVDAGGGVAHLTVSGGSGATSLTGDTTGTISGSAIATTTVQAQGGAVVFTVSGTTYADLGSRYWLGRNTSGNTAQWLSLGYSASGADPSAYTLAWTNASGAVTLSSTDVSSGNPVFTNGTALGGALTLAANNISAIKIALTGTVSTPLVQSVFLSQSSNGHIVVVGGSSTHATTDFEGGKNLIAFDPGGSANPTGPSSAISMLYSDVTAGGGVWSALNRSGSQLGSLTTQFAGAGAGSINTQAATIFTDTGFRTLTGTLQIYAYTTKTNTSGAITATLVCRALSAPGGGATGDTAIVKMVFAYKNIAGTVTMVGSGTLVSNLFDTSMSAAALSASASGAQVVFNATPGGSVTCDGTLKIDVVS